MMAPKIPATTAQLGYWWTKPSRAARLVALTAHRDSLAQQLENARSRRRKVCPGPDFREHCQTYQALIIANRRLAQLGIEGNVR